MSPCKARGRVMWHRTLSGESSKSTFHTPNNLEPSARQHTEIDSSGVGESPPLLPSTCREDVIFFFGIVLDETAEKRRKTTPRETSDGASGDQQQSGDGVLTSAPAEPPPSSSLRPHYTTTKSLPNIDFQFKDIPSEEEQPRFRSHRVALTPVDPTSPNTFPHVKNVADLQLTDAMQRPPRTSHRNLVVHPPSFEMFGANKQRTANDVPPEPPPSPTTPSPSTNTTTTTSTSTSALPPSIVNVHVCSTNITSVSKLARTITAISPATVPNTGNKDSGSDIVNTAPTVFVDHLQQTIVGGLDDGTDPPQQTIVDVPAQQTAVDSTDDPPQQTTVDGPPQQKAVDSTDDPPTLLATSTITPGTAWYLAPRTHTRSFPLHPRTVQNDYFDNKSSLSVPSGLAFVTHVVPSAAAAALREPAYALGVGTPQLDPVLTQLGFRTDTNTTTTTSHPTLLPPLLATLETADPDFTLPHSESQPAKSLATPTTANRRRRLSTIAALAPPESTTSPEIDIMFRDTPPPTATTTTPSRHPSTDVHCDDKTTPSVQRGLALVTTATTTIFGARDGVRPPDTTTTTASTTTDPDLLHPIDHRTVTTDHVNTFNLPASSEQLAFYMDMTSTAPEHLDCGRTRPNLRSSLSHSELDRQSCSEPSRPEGEVPLHHYHYDNGGSTLACPPGSAPRLSLVSSVGFLEEGTGLSSFPVLSNVNAVGLILSLTAPLCLLRFATIHTTPLRRPSVCC